MARLYAGTSGYAYPAWKPAFYPPDLPAARFLEHYASRLACVEINYTRFLEWLPRDTRFAFEFREASWFTEEVYDLLRAHDAALCVTDAEGLAVPDVATASFAYYRLRRPPYDDLALRRRRRRAEALLGEDRDVFVLFKHEDDAGGALEAERLLAV